METKKLYKKLQKEEALEILKKWLDLVKDSDEPGKLIREFFEEPLNKTELLKILDKQPVSKWLVGCVFDAINQILSSILDGLDDLESEALFIIQHVVRNHSSIVRMLINSGTPENGEAGLQFLINSAKLGSVAALEVLSNIKWSLLDFNKVAMKKLEEKGKPSLRVWVHRLALVYMNIENSKCLTQFLQFEQPIGGIFANLIDDKAKLVVDFLDTMHVKLLKNADVRKTLKLKIFSVMKCYHLLTFYGSPKNQWSDSEKKSVRTSLHKVMMTLCTSNKFGVVFQKENKHIFNILKSRFPIVKSKEGLELISSSMTACPDIRPMLLSALQSKAVSLDILPVLTLLSQVIEKDSPWLNKDFSFDEVAITRNLSYIPNLKIIKVLNDKSLDSKLAGIKILHTTYQKAIAALDSVETSLDSTQEQKEAVQEMVNKCLNIYLQHMEIISGMWDAVITKEPKDSDEALKRFEVLNLSALLMKHFIMVHRTRHSVQLIDPIQKLSALQQLPAESKNNERYLKCLGSVFTCIILAEKYSTLSLIDFSHIKIAEDGQVEQTTLYMLLETYLTAFHSTMETEVLKDVQQATLTLIFTGLETCGMLVPCNELEMWLQKIPAEDIKSRLLFVGELMLRALGRMPLYKEKIYQLEIDSGMECEDEVDIGALLEDLVVEDTEDICVIPSPAPFSVLVLAAVDGLTTTKDKTLTKYFSAVMSDYVHSLSAPEILARFLLLDESIITGETIEILQSFLGLEGNVMDSSSLGDSLANIFRSPKCPKFATVRHWLSDLESQADLAPLIRQLLLYIKLEKQCSFSNKRPAHLKLFGKVLKQIVEQFQTESKHKKPTLQLILSSQYLQDHYSPFNDMEPINAVIKAALEVASSVKVDLLRPYFDKLSSHFNCLSSIGNFDTLDIFKDFIPSTIYTYTRLEEILLTCCKLSTQDNASSIRVLHVIVEALCEITTKEQYPSAGSMKVILTKRNSLLADQDDDDVSTAATSIERLTIKVLAVADDKILRNDLCEELVLCTDLSVDLKISLVKQGQHLAKSVADQLSTAQQPCLSSEVALLACLVHNCGPAQSTHDVVKRYKKQMLSWANTDDSQGCTQHKTVLQYMLAQKIISSKSAKSMCNDWYERILNGTTGLPKHILCLSDVFNHCGVAHQCQLLFICVWGVRKLYKKDQSEHSEFLQNAPSLVVDLYDKSKSSLDQEFFTSKSYWVGFVKQILRTSLSDLTNGSRLLECLTTLCRSIFQHDITNPTTMSPRSIMEKLHSHSLFLPTMLSADASTESIKEALINLQQTLVDVDNSLCDTKHIPVLLGAYGATMSSSDQCVYKLLRTYEDLGCITTYPPVLWGSMAVSHFALEAAVATQVGSFRAPTSDQILQLIDPAKVVETALKFDPLLDLQASRCPCDGSIYDQRFLLLVFKHLCKNDQVPHVRALLESNVMALAISALTSKVDLVWSVGAWILKNVSSLLAARANKNADQHCMWTWSIEILRNSFRAERQALPTIMAHFLIRSTQLLSEPGQPAYKSVISQLFQNPSLHLIRIPGLRRLLFPSNSASPREDVLFVLSFLKTSIQTVEDWMICLKSHLPKFLLGLLQSEMTSLEHKASILEVLVTIAKLDSGAKFLVEDSNILCLLPKALTTIHPNPKGIQSERVTLLYTNLTHLVLTLWKYLLESSCTNTPHSANMIMGKRSRKASESSAVRATKKRKIEPVLPTTESNGLDVTCDEIKIEDESISSQEGKTSDCFESSTLLERVSALKPLLRTLPSGGEILSQMLKEAHTMKSNKSDSAQLMMSVIKAISQLRMELPTLAVTH